MVEVRESQCDEVIKRDFVILCMTLIQNRDRPEREREGTAIVCVRVDDYFPF
jgi:hypothetical protein